jgi:hypothetical protein
VYLLKNTQLWQKEKVLATTKSLLVRERRVPQKKHTTNTIELKRITVDKEDYNSFLKP